MIVVTGGAGFIGSCVIARLNQEGRSDLIVVDHLDGNPLKKKNLENKKYNRYFEKGDFLSLVLNDKIKEPIEAVIHMGACSSTTLSDENYYRTNNFEYSCHIAEWAVKRGARLIYASSAATYGDGGQGYSDADEVTKILKPLNLYGESKQKFDLWVLQRGWENRIVGLKFFNVFGPNEYHKGDMRSVVAKAFQRVANEGKMALFKSCKKEFTDGEQKRDFIYVRDAVNVVIFFLDHPEINGIFNVGTGEARTWNDLARALFDAVGKPVHIDYVEMPVDLRSKYQYFTQADMTKLRKSGYRDPFTSLEKAVCDYSNYLKSKTHL